MGFPESREIFVEWVQYDKIISDRGSKYSATGGRVTCRNDVRAFLKKLNRDKKYARATHNTWAARVKKDGAIFEVKSDDGETGAGNTILRELQKADVVNCVVVVTRWFGGVHLNADRFRHVQDATRYWVDRN